MNTQKPISTISWNTEKFLRDTLEALTKAHKIDYWEFIRHSPEDDEGGKKEHFHVYIEPSKRIQTAELREEFKEPDLRHPDQKPLGCLTFRNSVFSDWYLYALHDPTYLAAHQQSRKRHYTDDQIRFPDEDEHHYRVSCVDMSIYTPVRRLQAAKDAGMSFGEAVARGLVPIPQLSQFEKAWNYLADKTDRNGHPDHNVDPETGEVIS